ncbi:hypothetical protein DKX38_022396 [Salix brachista]|uniref:Co-chaperone protein p23 n=1 Tax=Salix brachista TaxID=2182728 RepID=A0A5N5KB95_9ROSI|nr:hypothetical protein DKX38_022396 [Salix brachista]
MSRHPEVLWAQKSDKVYLTIALPDAKDISVKCEGEGLFCFSAVGVQAWSQSVFHLDSDGQVSMNPHFEARLPVHADETLLGSKTKAGLRNIMCSIQKEEKVWWKRLLKSEEKPAPYIKVDWNKWCDEDDEESSSDTSDDNNAGYEKDDGSSEDEGMLLHVMKRMPCDFQFTRKIFLILRRQGELDDNRGPVWLITWNWSSGDRRTAQ